jgi:hypothetical protein
MNRRTFIKSAAVASVAPTALASVLPEPVPYASELPADKTRPFYVECYIREQKEWVFADYGKGRFINGNPRFRTLDEATDMVELHFRVANFDTNVHDVIYEIFYQGAECEFHCGHFWYNGDTGRSIYWRSRDPYQMTNWNKVEGA